MIQQGDVLAALAVAWNRNGTLKALVPGGLDYSTNQQTTSPYATLKLEEGEVEFNSGKNYVHNFTATIMVWSTGGAVDSADIGRAIDATYNPDRPQDILILGAKVLRMFPASGLLEEDEATREAKDQLVLHRRYDLMIQGER